MARKNDNLTRRIVTPVGTAIFPRLTTPDTKFNPEGVYTCKIRLDGADADSFALMVQDFLKEAAEVAKAVHGPKLRPGAFHPTPPAKDEDGNEIPGSITVNFKMKASGTNKAGKSWTNKPVVVDAAKNPVTELVFGGSKVRVAGEMAAYYTPSIGLGVSFRLHAVQVVELVTSSGAGRGADAFDVVEDGFRSQGAPVSDEVDNAPADGSDF